MPALKVSCLLLGLWLPLGSGNGVEVGPARMLAEQGGYTSCTFVAAGVGGWERPSVICSRVNETEVTEELWRIPLGKGEPELIGYGRQPRVRGHMLVYVGTEPGDEGIWLRDLSEDCEAQRLSKDPGLQWPDISPDGETVACYQATGRAKGIFLLPVNGDKGQWLARREERQPCYAPDGDRMVVTKHGQLWVLSGEIREQLQEERITDAACEHVDASWGPRGEWIVYVGRWTDEAANVMMLRLSDGRNIQITEGMSASM
ncbi:MAG: hypothetical protein J7M38_03070 [Armatimonadetes bacterium]|nr:hypothetical protein [Armatimonadota bacterium]